MKKVEKVGMFEIENKGAKYKLSIEGTDSELKIHIEEVDSIPKITFEENFTLERLTQKSKFFLLFETIDELMPDMLEFFTKKKYSLSLETNCAVISLFLPMKVVEEVILPIPQTESDPNSVIQELTVTVNKLNKQVNSMKNQITEMQKFIDLIKEDGTILGSINRRKALNSDKMILDDIERKVICDWISLNRKVKMTLIYKATRDGDSSSTFHNRCDGKGPTLTLVKTTTGYRCGGFVVTPWDSSGNYKKDQDAFVFSLDTRSKYMSTNNNSIYCNSGYGPTFGGGHDLYLANCFLTAGNSNYCNSPNTYKTSKKSELTGGEYNFTVKECEVYQISYEN